MLTLSRDKNTETFGDHVAALRIVPVAISYELDPCDAMKARELSQRASTGRYEKTDQEDVASIGKGISGQKGKVHLHFGKPLGSDLATPDAVADAIDAQIIRSYRLHPVNLWAYKQLHGEAELHGLQIAEGSCSEAEFAARIEAIPEADRPFALAGYANALRSALELASRT
jgi:hypothetical protein